MCVCLVIQLCPVLCDPMDCSPPGSSVYGIFQARILEWVSIHFSRGSSNSRTGLCGFFLMFYKNYTRVWASQVALVVKNLPASAGDTRDVSLIPESGRSPGEENGTHSGILAWRIPWTEEPGGLPSMGSQSQT